MCRAECPLQLTTAFLEGKGTASKKSKCKGPVVRMFGVARVE